MVETSHLDRNIGEIYEKLIEIFKTEQVMVNALSDQQTVVLKPTDQKGDISFKVQDFKGILLSRKGDKRIMQIHTRFGYLTYYFDEQYFDVSIERMEGLERATRLL